MATTLMVMTVSKTMPVITITESDYNIYIENSNISSGPEYRSQNRKPLWAERSCNRIPV